MGALPPHYKAIKERLQPFLDVLRSLGFSGDVAVDDASRTVYSTDNSIYQLAPLAVLFPRDGADIERVAKAAAQVRMPLSPRGGGTGTNGQSLTSGVIVDVSRHMNRIIHFNPDALDVTVEPGVVLDQLNAFLKPHGLFFPPTVSTASRATIGGMVATDASGKGSRIYGRTSDYIAGMDVVFSDGTPGKIGPVAGTELDQLLARQDRLGQGARAVHKIVTEQEALIRQVFPDMNRGLTGYNLKQVTGDTGAFLLHKLLAGSEGTLAFTRSITLRLIRRPRVRGVAVLRYTSFSAALDDVTRLLGSDPAAIEIMDDKVLALAREDVVWTSLEAVLGGPTEHPVGGLNVVEFVGDEAADIDAQLARLAGLPVPQNSGILDQIIIRDNAVVSTIWDLRKKAVGLLGRLGGVPFIEDTAVPPTSLPAYVKEFRALLDAYGLDYGMFGHADVGCLHVRPVLDMRDPAHAALIRPLSDAIAALTHQYGGLLWGEHGRGFRGEFSPLFFGSALYGALAEIKTAFDPENLFNPGKIARPHDGAPLYRIDNVPFRGELDRQISPALGTLYGKAVDCNGNGACHGWDAFDLMCPSYKVTRDRNQSPKGRAALLREWTRRVSTGEDRKPEFDRFEGEVKAALDTCLSCKACASLCPVRVDVPAMKAQFNATYYDRHKRPMRHLLFRGIEVLLAVARKMPGLANRVAGSRIGGTLFDRLFGLVDLPSFNVPASAKRSAARTSGKTVILLEDTFTSSFDGIVVMAAEALLLALGYNVRRVSPLPNGKVLHVNGMLPAFKPVAERAMARLGRENDGSLPVIALDSAIGLMYSDEYAHATGAKLANPVLGLEQFLGREIASGSISPVKAQTQSCYTLLPHCTEKAARPLVTQDWASIFSAFGLGLATPPVGCCGMAGMFGHEKEHKTLSESLFQMSWKPILDKAGHETVLASGFSCRCQTKRFEGFRPRHPVEALLEHVQSINLSHRAPEEDRLRIGTVDAE